MGLFGKKMKDPVEGTARVVSAYIPPRASSGNCKMHLVIEAPGMAPASIEHHAWFVPTDRWPEPGDIIPVTVDRADPEKIDIDWKARPSASEQAAAQADALAARLSGAGGQAAPTGESAGGLVGQLQQMFPGATVHVQEASVGDLPPGALSQMEQALGVDLDGDGHVGPAGTAAAGAAGGRGEDRIAQLERLATLHKSGALSDEEFAAEKRRILGG